MGQPAKKTLADYFGSRPKKEFKPGSQRQPIGVVQRTAEFERIKGLPRRIEPPKYDLTKLLKTDKGTMRLFPLQSQALYEIAKHNGGMVPLPVGTGKTLVALLCPTVLKSKKTIILIPPGLREQYKRKFREYLEHWKIKHGAIHLFAYSELSQAKKADWLDKAKPDLIVCDEAHNLKRFQSARTRRFMRFAKDNPQCRFVFMSGTFCSKSILDFDHLSTLALRKNSPVPMRRQESRDWAGAIDLNPMYPMGPGALLDLCEGEETPREGFRRRLRETEGFIVGDEQKLGVSLTVKRIKFETPSVIIEQMNKVDKLWRIGDHEIVTAIEKNQILAQLGLGFWYSSDWPNNQPDYAYIEAKRGWDSEVRARLQLNLRGQDSPLLCAQAAERHLQWEKSRGRGKSPPGAWQSVWWEAWKVQKQKPAPPRKVNWISAFALKHVQEWAKKQKKGAIIWYRHKSLGRAIAKVTGLPLYGAGTDASTATAPIIICSQKAQGTGKNLQYHYYKNLFVELPENAESLEQIIGRTHREGQKAEEVMVEWFGHTDRAQLAFERLIENAKFIFDTTGLPQKILFADLIDVTEKEKVKGNGNGNLLGS